MLSPLAAAASMRDFLNLDTTNREPKISHLLVHTVARYRVWMATCSDELGAGLPYRPPMPVSVMPAMIRRWKIAYKISGGVVASAAAAIVSPR